MVDKILKLVCVVLWIIAAFAVLNVMYDVGHPKPIVVPCTTDTECVELNPNLEDY
jgi:hypothetical protein